MRNKKTNELAVCGVNAVSALAKQHPEQIRRLFLRKDRLPIFTKACKYLAEQKRLYKFCEDDELERLCKSPRHQGVVAMIMEPEPPTISSQELDEWSSKRQIGLILDSVGNDNNLGAIIRSAAFFGATWIILSERDREARLTTSAYRVAEGGMEYVRIRKADNIEAFVKAAEKKMLVLGAHHRARLRLKDLPTLADPFPHGFAVVVGNEETGLSLEVERACSYLVRIPGSGQIESLNVAQAATLFLHEISTIF
ncbi:TrmH family RNA methyltransferase [Gracilinema caldarium]|nr:RNA methyltransferase [Gracilinema caldarium]